MSLVIINGAVRPQKISNTAAIIDSFRKGYEETRELAAVYHLSDRRCWEAAKAAFQENDNILIAFPLYVENLPGPLLEFLSGLSPKDASTQTRLAFLVQGGFDEACQLRCCEAFLETLPEKLNCRYIGTLLKGGNFGIRFMKGKAKEKLLNPWEEMGRSFAGEQTFDTEAARKFAGAEYLPEREAKAFMCVGRYIMRLFMNHLSRKMGRTKSLMDRPYAGQSG